jgi:hypothetical protein
VLVSFQFKEGYFDRATEFMDSSPGGVDTVVIAAIAGNTNT